MGDPGQRRKDHIGRREQTLLLSAWGETGISPKGLELHLERTHVRKRVVLVDLSRARHYMEGDPSTVLTSAG